MYIHKRLLLGDKDNNYMYELNFCVVKRLSLVEKIKVITSIFTCTCRKGTVSTG